MLAGWNKFNGVAYCHTLPGGGLFVAAGPCIGLVGRLISPSGCPACFVDYVLTGIRDKLQVGFEYTLPLRSAHQNMLSAVKGVASV